MAQCSNVKPFFLCMVDLIDTLIVSLVCFWMIVAGFMLFVGICFLLFVWFSLGIHGETCFITTTLNFNLDTCPKKTIIGDLGVLDQPLVCGIWVAQS